MVDRDVERQHFVRKYNAKYSTIVKLEIVCLDDEAMRFTDIIMAHAHTGERGDGRIFVSTIDHATNIRTGAEGDAAL